MGTQYLDAASEAGLPVPLVAELLNSQGSGQLCAVWRTKHAVPRARSGRSCPALNHGTVAKQLLDGFWTSVFWSSLRVFQLSALFETLKLQDESIRMPNSRRS